MSAPVGVCAPRDQIEYDAAIDTSSAVFLGGNRSLGEVWYDALAREPGYRPELVRAAFLDGSCVGVTLIRTREILIHGAPVSVAFIGGVGVREEYRHRGIGTALMQDVRGFAKQRRIAVCLLIGAHLFYDPFGYVDIFDSTGQVISKADIQGAPAESGWSVRRASPDDADAVLQLYQLGHGSYTGCAVRAVAEMEHFLRITREQFDHEPETTTGAGPRVAIDSNGRVGGYTAFPYGVHTWAGCEAVAPSWPIASALLRDHAALPDGPDAPNGRAGSVVWQLPSDCLTLQCINDHLPVTSYAVRHPSTGWMAVASHLEGLLGSLEPRWRVLANGWPCGVRLSIDGTCSLELGPPGRCVPANLGSAVFVQLVFGYRTVEWALEQEGARIDADAVPLLDDLMGSNRTWIAPSDGR